MDGDHNTSPQSVDFSNNFSGIPNTPPVIVADQERPLFSIGVETPEKPTVVETNESSSPLLKNLQDVGGAHLTVENKGGMHKSKSSPALLQFLNLAPGSKAMGNVNIQVNVPGFTNDQTKTSHSDEGSSVDHPVNLNQRGSAGILATREPQTIHVRKAMQSYYSGGAVNKYGSLFRKPGMDHKAVATAAKTTEAIPSKTPLQPTQEEAEDNLTPHVTLGQRFQKWITTTPVKQTGRETNAFSPTSF